MTGKLIEYVLIDLATLVTTFMCGHHYAESKLKRTED